MGKLQVTGRGAPKLVGVSDGPERPGRGAGRVLGGLAAASASLGGIGREAECVVMAFRPHPYPAWHTVSGPPPSVPLLPSVLEVPALGSGRAGLGHSLSSR